MMATLAPLSTATSTPTVNCPPSGAAGAIKFKQTKGREAIYSVFCVTSESFGACQNEQQQANQTKSRREQKKT